MIGLCKDCQHWNKDDDWADNNSGKLDRGVCRLAESSIGKAVNQHSKAVAFDCEDYQAKLITDADFGCVQFEGRCDR